MEKLPSGKGDSGPRKQIEQRITFYLSSLSRERVRDFEEEDIFKTILDTFLLPTTNTPKLSIWTQEYTQLIRESKWLVSVCIFLRKILRFFHCPCFFSTSPFSFSLRHRRHTKEADSWLYWLCRHIIKTIQKGANWNSFEVIHFQVN